MGLQRLYSTRLAYHLKRTSCLWPLMGYGRSGCRCLVPTAGTTIGAKCQSGSFDKRDTAYADARLWFWTGTSAKRFFASLDRRNVWTAATISKKAVLSLVGRDNVGNSRCTYPHLFSKTSFWGCHLERRPIYLTLRVKSYWRSQVDVLQYTFWVIDNFTTSCRHAYQRWKYVSVLYSNILFYKL